jgi:hypothetical protein
MQERVKMNSIDHGSAGASLKRREVGGGCLRRRTGCRPGEGHAPGGGGGGARRPREKVFDVQQPRPRPEHAELRPALRVWAWALKSFSRRPVCFVMFDNQS